MMVASPFPAQTSSDVVAQGCPHHSYPRQAPPWCFPCVQPVVPPWDQPLYTHRSLFWVTNDSMSDAALFLVARAPSAFC